MIEAYRPDDVTPYRPSVLDIETAQDGSLLCLGFAYENAFKDIIYNTYDTWEAWLNALYMLLKEHRRNQSMRRKLLYIYAHNGANFDWLSLIELLMEKQEAKDINYIMSDSLGIGVNVTLRSNMTLHLRDSSRLLPGKLADIAEKLAHTKKIKLADKYKSNMALLLRENPEAFYTYLRADVIGLQESIYTFWRMIYEIAGSIGHLPMTLPALALRLFRKGMPEEHVISTPWNKDVKNFTRRAYTGGRVECYRPGTHAINVYDVNSMYPAVMQKYTVPCSHRTAWTNTYYKDAHGFYEVVFEQTNKSVPPVLRDESTNEFVYEGSGVYTVPELNLFSEYGTFEIKRGLIFQHVSNVFKDFVDKYYGLRLAAQEEGNEALSYICKIMLNSLYGKFGQKSLKGSIILADRNQLAEHIKAGAKVTVLGDGDFAQVVEESEIANEFVAIAAYITSYARITIYGHIIAAGNEYVYCDTDSVHTRGELPVSAGLGGLKHEAQGTGAYIGKKLYGITSGDKQKVTAKGIGRIPVSDALTYNDMHNLATGATTAKRIDFYAFPTVKEVLSGNKACKLAIRTRTINGPNAQKMHSKRTEQRVDKINAKE